MAGIARDGQVTRESIQKQTANVRDGQLTRESIASYVANVRNVQVFREAIIVRGTSATQPFLFITT
jgi:hypothetical protein